MAIFVVLAPPLDDRGDPEQPERFRFVRDGFSWRAFAFGPLWMLRHRLWLALFLYIVIVGALVFATYAAHVSLAFAVLAVFLLAILIGLESATLRRSTLLRRRWRDLGIVAANDADDAVRRFFDHWVVETSQVRAGPPGPARYLPVRDPGSDIIGLFPEPGAQR
jgi:uncharacterized protein (DUF58 family)